jgi:uncharacterized protein
MNQSTIYSQDNFQELRAKLSEVAKDAYPLPIFGTHGIRHWSRVAKYGAVLCRQVGVNWQVVDLFSFMHDCQRENEIHDPQHGPRAETLLRKIRGIVPLEGDDFERLCIACRLHTSDQRHPDPTVAACFDADRLDLGRVGIRPDPKLMASEQGAQLAQAMADGVSVLELT